MHKVSSKKFLLKLKRLNEEANGEEAPAEDTTTVQVSGAAEPAPTDKNPMDVAMAAIEEKMKVCMEAITEVAKDVSGIKEEMGAMKTKMEKFAKMPAAVAAPKVTNISAEEFGGIDAKVELLKSLRK